MAAVILSVLLQYYIVQLAWMQDIFKVVPLDAGDWLLAIGLALAPLVLGEMQKTLKLWRSTNDV